MSGAIPSLPNTPSWHGAQLKHRDNFTFYILIIAHFNAAVFSFTCHGDCPLARSDSELTLHTMESFQTFCYDS
jgi:hypothetical protein